jgi:hypothetical protein
MARAFPGAAIDAQIQIVSAAQFAANTVAAHPQAGLRALRAMSARFTTPPRAAADIVNELHQRYAMTEVADLLRPLLEDRDAAPA